MGTSAVQMPVINECAVENCAYNNDRACHALAITVGDAHHPHCDTFCPSPPKGGEPSATGHVGACKMADCRHNSSLECHAPGISVGYLQDEVDCLTYAPA
ncbi:DUF1540 domain-containing protein [Streptomyces sp. GC420]|uniref:DUF1540 domain-containing protein n=1 Tax=Streptomyces sp. GC420 TaxID=2697568 RepID=UPI00141524BB|nr:DUF1540 domain-containing protein [Streptomyces sp. GC420]NBM16510.1 DUF1540 domain-containing protein [Streptomyces sp. GC420]